MSEVYINWPGLLILMIISLVSGLISITSPITIIKLWNLWPRFIYPKVFGIERISPKTREAWDVMDNHPEEYAKRYKLQVINVRITGLVALFIFMVGVMGIVAYWFSGS